MKPFATCVFVALLSGALASPEGVSRWESFKSKHAKQHAAHEEPERMRAFLERDAEIQAHNERYARGEESYSRQHSQYSDLTIQEFRKFALGFVPAKNVSDIPFAVQGPAAPSVPDSFSWLDQGVMTPVKNQLYCGSCYAFAGAGALEGYLKWKSGQAYDLSEQDIVDCSYKKFMGGAHNGGCDGGWPDAVYDHYKVKDLIYENEYKYTSGMSQKHGYCQIPNAKRDVVRRTLRYRNERVRNENDIRNYLVAKGPLVVALAADNAWKPFFDDLGDGVFDNRGSINAQPNHAVVLVGYGNHKGKDYWLIKNSWGADWATGGYGKIARGKNMCGIATFGVWYIE